MRLSALIGVLSAATTALAQNWYTIEWEAPQLTALSGDMVVPKLQNKGGTSHVWPGVQSGNGALQAVLDGWSGIWWIGDDFHGNPSIPWGNGFNVNPGDTVRFTFQLSGPVPGHALSAATAKNATTALNIPNNTMNRAIFAVELYSVPFNFGPVVYRNIRITANTAASGWCHAGGGGKLGTYPLTISGVSASGNTCNIGSITQSSAA
ncbi:hypothetical protein BDV98DRAFT_554963 [Pterulicium gracile]|uniref:DUF4430 domain-containing protein n=1 Tax=Pterulicium gracile TaxID=1884261 RepID=A0A5C3Q556_9AGAR|nr:hypothetical protein BDV98DRAFT_554963 [Pterula gracilis]